MFLAEFSQFIGQCANYVTPSMGLIGGLFVMGLVGGVTHCAGMCGPFILSQTGNMTKLSDGLLLPYHLGRITTYTLLSILMYSLVNILSFYSPARIFIIVPLLVLAGTLFLVNAFPAWLRIFPWLARVTVPFAPQVIQRLSGRMKYRFFLGMVLGLMPCGMVMAAIMAASTDPSIWGTVFSMIAFGFGTMPMLVVVATGGRKLSQEYPVQMAYVRRGLMVWSGLWLFIMAGLTVMRG